LRCTDLEDCPCARELNQRPIRRIDKSGVAAGAAAGVPHRAVIDDIGALVRPEPVSLAETVRMATQNPATVLGLEGEIGALSVGMPADLSVMRLLEGEWTLVDSERVTHKARQLLHPEFAVRGGKVHRADSPLLPAFAGLAA
jgi:cytosine/adenosine deaminase-related metal-dependent hydrolase